MEHTMTPRTLIDRNGRLHSVAVLKHWTPRMLEIMGVRKATPEEQKSGDATCAIRKAGAANG